MKKPLISIIAAIGKNRELGKDNKLLWNISEDMKRFKKLTIGHPVIMGRTTYESIGKPLPYRTNIIVTRNPDFKSEDAIITHSVEEAIEVAKKYSRKEIFIIGGAQIYAQGLKFADKLYITLVHGEFEADAYFPDYSEFKKVIYEKKNRLKDNPFTFLELIR